MTSVTSPVDLLSGDYPRLPRPALFTLAIGRLRVVTVLDGLGEQYGQQVESVGALPVPAEPSTRSFAVKLPVYSPSGPFNPGKDGRRLRRQLRGLLENDLARLEPVLWQWDADPDAAVFVVLGSGALEDTGGGASAFADWTLSLDGAARVGTPQTHRLARQLFARPLASGSTPRDTKGLIVATDLAAANTFAVHGLPANAGGSVRITNQSGGLPAVGVRTIRPPGNRGGQTSVYVAAGQPSGTVLDMPPDPSRAGVGDVVAVDRRGLLETWVFGHSVTTGYSLPDEARQRWPAIRATVRNRGVERYYAVPGSSVGLDAASGNGGYVQVAQNFVVANRFPGQALFLPGGQWEAILNWGIADLASFGIEGAAAPANGNYTPFIRAMRYCISRVRSVAMCPINQTAAASDASVSFTGSWTDHADTDKNSGTGWRGTTTGGFTWTSPGNVLAGQAVALNGLTIPGNNKLTVTATLVGCGETRTSTFTVDGNAGQGWGNGTRYTPWCERFTDLVGGGTYTLTVTTAGAVGTGCGFDGVNVEFADRVAPQVLVFTAPRFPGGDAAYAAWFATQPHQPTNAALDMADQRLVLLAQEFGGAPAGVCVGDLGGQLGLDLASRVADLVHLNEWGQRRVENAAWEGAERSGEEMFGPAHPRVAGDAPNDTPVLENGCVRIRPYDGDATNPTPLYSTLAVDVPNFTYPCWDEVGRVVISDQTANGGAWSDGYSVAVSSNLVSYSPERAVMRVVIARNIFDTSATTEVFVTLERGQRAFRVEAYSSSGPPGVAASRGLAVRFVPNSTGSRAYASPVGGLSSADPGAAWNNTNSAFDMAGWLGGGAQPWVALVDESAAASPVAVGLLRGNHLWRLVDDTSAYGGTARRAVQAEAPYGSTPAARGYVAATIGVIGATAQSGQAVVYEAKDVRNTGSGTTSAQTVASSRSGTVTRETQTSDAAATLKATLGASVDGRYLCLARVSSTVAASTFSVYHKCGGGGTQSSPSASTTPGTSLSGVAWMPVGEAVLVNGQQWELHAWRTAGTGAINIDAVMLVPTERRAAAAPYYDGAADLVARGLLEHRAVSALVTRGS